MYGLFDALLAIPPTVSVSCIVPARTSAGIVAVTCINPTKPGESAAVASVVLPPIATLKGIAGTSSGSAVAACPSVSGGSVAPCPVAQNVILEPRAAGFDVEFSVPSSLRAMALSSRMFASKPIASPVGASGAGGDPARCAASAPFGACAAIDAPALTGGVQRVVGGGQIVPIPGQPGELIDERILPDLLWIIQTFHARVTDGYAPTGHAADGEHPLGLAVDLVPGPGGSWDDIDRLAQLAEPAQNQPRTPWRWVGYNGDPNHGRGNHLHLSWQHGPGRPGNRPPAAWVLTLARGSE